MSTHPNVMLQCVLTVEDSSRKTERSLIEEYSGDGGIFEDCVVIEGKDFNLTVMESDYDYGYQISANEGQLVLHDYLTYGYGETVASDDLFTRIDALRNCAESAKGKHKFSYEIRIGANYW